MASDVISLQGSAGSITVAPLGLEPPAVDSLDDLGMEVIKCCEGLDLISLRRQQLASSIKPTRLVSVITEFWTLSFLYNYIGDVVIQGGQ